MNASVMLPRLTPEAEAMVLRLVHHLDNDPNAGAYLILSRQTAERPQVDTTWGNIGADGIVTGMLWGCHDVLAILRTCQCGMDHSTIIAALERVSALLSGKAGALQ